MGRTNKYKPRETKPAVIAPIQQQPIVIDKKKTNRVFPKDNAFSGSHRIRFSYDEILSVACHKFSAQLGPGPATSSGNSGFSGRQQPPGSQGGQGLAGQRVGQQQPRIERQTGSFQPQQRGASQQQRSQGQPNSFHQQQRQYGQQRRGQPAGSVRPWKPGQVGVNYLEIDLKNMPDEGFHYDVKIQPERPKKFYKQAFEQFRIDQLGGLNVSFDGRASCYSVDRLPTYSQNPEVTVTDNHGRCLSYTVEIKETADPVINLSSLKSNKSKSISDKPMREMQCLEVVLSSPCHRKAIRAGRSFYQMSKEGERMDLGDGYEALVGLYQAIVLGERLFLNVDISHKSFPIAMTVLEYLKKYVLKDGIIDHKTNLNISRHFIESFLKGLSVVYTPPKSFASAPRCYKVNGLSKYPASSQKFELDGRTTTIEDYFKDRKYVLEFPQLHCLHVGPPKKNIMVPIELCAIEGGQVLNRKDGADQVAEMIKFAATSTNDRKIKIMNLLKFFNHNLDPTISRFGIRIASDFIMVNTRTLLPPQVVYKDGELCAVRNGSWRMDKMQFLEAKPKVHKWAILYLNGKMLHGQVADFEQKVRVQGETVGLSLEEKAQIRSFKDECDLDYCFKDLQDRCDLAFVIIPQVGVTYDTIKQKAELKYGILTQCIKQNTVRFKLKPQTIGNILLKVNYKLNGINHKLMEDTNLPLIKNVMFLGADVTHPSPDQSQIPSVVSVVASLHPFGGVYNMEYRLQRPTLEVIEDMKAIAIEHLHAYKKYRNAYPENIIYYRDGVDDGQFPKIKCDELGGIKAACQQLEIEPKICCIIVVKRHHTRFFPKGETSIYNQNNNVEPGTVVDHTIVHPGEVQFYMVSHQSMLGTARPTRYNVIENTGNLDIDLIQRLTYNLCHMFPRCNRSVSYPAPAYLAHQGAARARVYLTGTLTFLDSNGEYAKPKIVPKFKEANPMYFI